MLIDVLPPDVTRTAPLGGPGADVQRATQVAERVAEELHDSGHELTFALPGDGGRVQAHLLDQRGAVVATLSPTEILALACGEAVPGVPIGGEARWPSP